jgi:hypothetical protein
MPTGVFKLQFQRSSARGHATQVQDIITIIIIITINITITITITIIEVVRARVFVYLFGSSFNAVGNTTRFL